MTPTQIRALRKNLNLYPDEFAEQLGFTDKSRRITVWRWETGKRKPSTQTIMLMKQLALNDQGKPPKLKWIPMDTDHFSV